MLGKGDFFLFQVPGLTVRLFISNVYLMLGFKTWYFSLV